jgi:hypothetical protein
MGRGRGRSRLLGAVSALAIVVAGCGTDSHENRPRPPQPVAVTVSISERGVLIQPTEIGVSGAGAADLTQNEGVEQPEANPNEPLPVTFTISNLTGHRTKLEFNGPTEVSSDQIVPNGTGELRTDLDTGDYQVSAAEVANGKTSPFSVGAERPSSQQDLLLP